MSFNFFEDIILKIPLSETLALSSIISAILMAIANYWYQQSCSKRYGIDGSNFEFNEKFSLLSLFFTFLVLTSISIENLSFYLFKPEQDKIISIILTLLVLYMPIFILFIFINFSILSIENIYFCVVLGLITEFIYFKLLTSITDPACKIIIYKFIKTKNLIKFNSILSVIFFVCVGILILFILLLKFAIKDNRVNATNNLKI